MLIVASLVFNGVSASAALFGQTSPKTKTDNANKSVTKIVEPPAALLPVAFDGWVESAKPIVSNKVEVADAANAAALTEYGFDRFADEHYTRGADMLTVKAMQFPDATGAFGAFTLYRKPNMAAEEIGSQFEGNKALGDGGASGPGSAAGSTRVLFWSGTVLVDAEFSRINAMTAAEMRDLAKLLPSATSAHALIPPPLPRYLPAKGLEAMTVRYALGKAGYELTGGVLPSAMVGFDRSAEAVTADYSVSGFDGTLTLLEYPTPQLAMGAEKALTDVINGVKAQKNGAKAGVNLPDALVSSAVGALQIRRSGPLVAITSGNFTPHEAELLVGSIHYDADITWNNPTGYISEPTKAARLLVNIILGSAVICLIALALGIALGGGRALMRVLRGKSASAMDETTEFIKLNLRD